MKTIINILLFLPATCWQIADTFKAKKKLKKEKRDIENMFVTHKQLRRLNGV